MAAKRQASVSGKAARATAVTKLRRPRAGDRPLLGVIGGSGIDTMPGLTDTRWRKVMTPWGPPSDDLLFGRIGETDIVFLPRHGRGHPLTPSGINYRANIDALKRVGCRDVVSLSACGSFREELSPGTFVIVDQFIDRTHARTKTFFDNGMVAHVSMAEPVCSRLGDALEAAARRRAIPVHRGGTYLVMEGPQFSSLAESNLYRSWNCDVIGMTNMPEAKLAREAELCYATVAMVTDYDCWHDSHAAVDVAGIVRVLQENAVKAKNLIAAVSPGIGAAPHPCPQGCNRVLDTAMITAPAARDPRLLAKLDAVAGRVIG